MSRLSGPFRPGSGADRGAPSHVGAGQGRPVGHVLFSCSLIMKTGHGNFGWLSAGASAGCFSPHIRPHAIPPSGRKAKTDGQASADAKRPQHKSEATTQEQSAISQFHFMISFLDNVPWLYPIGHPATRIAPPRDHPADRAQYLMPLFHDISPTHHPLHPPCAPSATPAGFPSWQASQPPHVAKTGQKVMILLHGLSSRPMPVPS